MRLRKRPSGRRERIAPSEGRRAGTSSAENSDSKILEASPTVPRESRQPEEPHLRYRQRGGRGGAEPRPPERQLPPSRRTFRKDDRECFAGRERDRESRHIAPRGPWRGSVRRSTA